MNGETLLLRQVNPSWIQQGRLTSQVFRPTPKDEKLLSVYDGDMISAENAWKHFTDRLHCASVGVRAVTLHECEIHSLVARPDPDPFPEHAVIDFSGHPENQIKSLAKQLSRLADIRGWLYRPDLT